MIFPRQLAAPVSAPAWSICWEEPSCLLCGRRHWSLLLEAPDPLAGNGLWFAVVQCQGCGLCFTNPRPDRATIGQFYPADYRPHRVRGRLRGCGFPRPWRRLPGRTRYLVPWQGQGRLLDFGCGNSSFLQRMHRSGWQVTGLDISPAAVRHIQADFQLPALVGTLPHPGLRPHSFDVITMWQSLEHVHDPLGVLREAYRLLVPGGKLLLAVPNIDSLPFRWFGQAWIGLDLPRHLTHFTPGTLKQMLERAGFRVRRMGMIRHSHWLRSSAAFSCKTSRGPHWHRWLKHKPISRLATWYGYLTNQADCLMVTARREAEGSKQKAESGK